MQIVGSNISEMCLSVPPNSVGCGPKKWSPKMILSKRFIRWNMGRLKNCHVSSSSWPVKKLRHKELVLLRRRPQRPRRATWMVGDFLGSGFQRYPGGWKHIILYTLIFIYIYIYTCIHQHIICVFIRTLYYAYSLVISIYILCNIYNVSSSYLYHTIWWFLPVAVISTSWKIGQSCPFCGASLNHPKEFDWVSKKSAKKNCKQKSFSKHLVVIFQPPKQWLLDWMLCPQSSVRLTHRGVGVGPEAFSSLAPWIFSRTCAMKIEELYPWNGAHHRPSKSKKWDSSQKNPWWF